MILGCGTLNAEGVVDGAESIPSPNCDERPAGMPVELVVIHSISLPPGIFGGEGVRQLFTNTLNPEAHPYYQDIASLKVSAHFFIRRDGALLQFVPCQLRAWHAGISEWRGRSRCNDFSIGIELEGCDDSCFTEAQYDVLNRLLALICQCYPIQAVVGHQDIAPERKTDPGPCFEWSKIVCASSVTLRG